MARVGIDIDGVLYPFWIELKRWLANQHYPALEKVGVPTHWHFYKDWGMTEEQFDNECHNAVNYGNVFWSGDPYPGAREALLRLQKAGHEIVLITNRFYGKPGISEKATEYWLRSHQIPYDELHLVRDKTTVQPRPDYFIDDAAHNVEAMRDVDVYAVLCERPWNNIHPGERMSLAEFVDLVITSEKLKSGDLPFPPGATVTYNIEEPKVKEKVYNAETGEVRVTSETGGQKGKKPARFDLIPSDALWQVAELYGKGAEKYDDWNWRKGYPWSLSIASLQRHLHAWLMGEEIDPETGCHHLTSVVFHALGLLTFVKEHPEFDDRFKPEA